MDVPRFSGVGTLLALVVLVLSVVLFAVGRLDLTHAALFGLLAASRLLP